MYCLLEVVSVCPEKLAPRFVDKIDWIKVSIFWYCYLTIYIHYAVIKYQDRVQHHTVLIV